ncbi:MAG: GIY-YIG nuclease family protein [Chloroflexi bacterium]|nr:GIY-YIG nuclease family protein [Chloroflexota bacterium]
MNGAEVKRRSTFYVYILHCSDGSYYVGHTDNLEKRIAEHDAGLVPGYTQGRKPVRLVFADYFSTRIEALERERQIKGWSRSKKEALIQGDRARIKQLARARQQSSTSAGDATIG